MKRQQIYDKPYMGQWIEKKKRGQIESNVFGFVKKILGIRINSEREGVFQWK